VRRAGAWCYGTVHHTVVRVEDTGATARLIWVMLLPAMKMTRALAWPRTTDWTRRAADMVRGYRILAQVLRDFAEALVIPFDTAAAMVFEGLVIQRMRIGTMDLRCIFVQ
jgi:hypothetical protein